MELDLKQLREIAEAPGVRPGSWNVYDRGIGYEVHDENGYELTGGMRETFDKADATHIATFDPPTVLALLSRLEQAEHGERAAKSELQDVVNEGIRQKKRAIKAERLIEKVRAEAQRLADSYEPAGENFLSILDGEQDG